MKANRFTYSQEQREWLIFNWENRNGRSNAQLTEEFNRFFHTQYDAHKLESQVSHIKRIGHSSRGILCHTEEQDQWIIENYYLIPRKDYVNAYNERFGTNLGRSIENYSIKLLKKTGNYKGQRDKSMWNRRFITQEEINWLKQHKSKMTTKELTAEFNKTFNRTFVSIDTIKRLMYQRGLKLANFGKSVSNKTTAITRMPIGSTIFRANNLYVKIVNYSSKELRDYCKKHNIKNSHGGVQINYDPRFMRYDAYVLGFKDKCPEDKVIIHLDGNPLNCEKDNLRVVDRKVMASLATSGLLHNGEFTEIAINVVETDFVLKRIEKQ